MPGLLVTRNLLNIASLTVTQASNAVLPLVIFPYALSVLGAELYSRVVTGEAIAVLILAVVLYSFEVDGVSRAGVLSAEHDNAELSSLFSCILTARLLIFIFLAAIVAFITWLYLRDMLPVIGCWMLLPLGYALQPAWLFLAQEVNWPIAVISVATRAAAVLAVWVLLDEPQDYLVVPLAIGTSMVVGAVASLCYARQRFSLRFVPPAWVELRHMLHTGKNIFFGNVSVALYKDINVLLLGILPVSSTSIAAYSIAEKLIKALQACVRPLNQFFYAKVIRIARADDKSGRDMFALLMRMIVPQLIALIVGIVAIVLLLWIVPLIPLVSESGVRGLLLVMVVAVFAGVANFMLGTVGLNMLGKSRALFHAIVGTGLASVVFTVVLGGWLGVYGAAISFAFAELLLLGLIFRQFKINYGLF